MTKLLKLILVKITEIGLISSNGNHEDLKPEAGAE